MIASLRETIAALPEGAVGSFNTLDLDMAAAVIEAAEGASTPAVIGIAARTSSRCVVTPARRPIGV